jgi:hypothetical protein
MMNEKVWIKRILNREKLRMKSEMFEKGNIIEGKKPSTLMRRGLGADSLCVGPTVDCRG